MSEDQLVPFLVEKVLIPYVLSSAQPLAKRFGDKAADKMESLYNRVKSKFSSDSTASIMLEKFNKNPEEYKAVIRDIIKEKIDEDPSFKDFILKLTRDIKDDPLITVYLKNIKADKMVGQDIENMKSGTSNTVIEDSEGQEVFGFKAKKLVDTASS